MPGQLTAEDLQADPHYIFLSALLVSQYLFECMEKLKGSNYYKGRLRNGLNIVSFELKELLLKDVPPIKDPEGRTDLIGTYIKEMMHECCMLKPEHMAVIAIIVRRYAANPQEILDYLKIQITDDMPT